MATRFHANLSRKAGLPEPAALAVTLVAAAADSYPAATCYNRRGLPSQEAMMQEVEWAKGVLLGSPYAYVLAVTVNEAGIPNAMGVGWWTYLSAKPRLLGMAIAPQRYTHDCLQQVPEFTLCFPGKELALPAWRCGQISGRAVNKFEELGLTPLPSKQVKPPLIEGSTVAFECRVANALETGDHIFDVGEIVAVHGDLENREHLYTEFYSRVISMAHDGKPDWKLEETLGLPDQLSL